MKKTIVLILLCLGTTTISFAQKGSILLYGNITYESASTNDQQTGANAQSGKTDFLSFSPGIGYQFSNRWTGGLVLAYTHNGQSYVSNTGSGSTDEDEYAIGPFIRYSYPLASWVSVYGQFQAQYQTLAKTEADPYSPNSTLEPSHELNFNLFPAFYFPIKHGWGLNMSFGGIDYYTTHVNTVGTTGKAFEVTFGSSATIGISKNFGGSKAKGA